MFAHSGPHTRVAGNDLGAYRRTIETKMSSASREAPFDEWMSQRPSSTDDAPVHEWAAQFVAWCVRVPNADMIHFHHSEWIEYVKSMVYTRARFNPVRSDRTFVFAKGRVRWQQLPNDTYRALLLHLVLRVPSMTPPDLCVLRRMLMAMEENGITGFVHVPHVAPFRRILPEVASTCAQYNVELETACTHVPELDRIVRSVVLCNTSVVFVINAALRERAPPPPPVP